MTQAGIVVLTIPSPPNIQPFAVRNEGGPNTKIKVVYTEALTHL
jgi:hypothetical protein